MDYRHIRVTRLIVALAIVVIFIVTAWSYWRRVSRLEAGKQNVPDILPRNVENATVGFNYSKIESGQTIYSIKAWRNLGLKGNKNILEDVEVIIYGHGGDRYDRIHSERADYDQDAGSIMFQGDVTLFLSSKKQEAMANASAGGPAGNATANKTSVKTTRVTYSQRDNRVDTDQRVQFVFNDVSGSAVGMHYDAAHDLLRLPQDVQIQLDRGGGEAPVQVTSTALDFVKSTRQISLDGPVEIRRGEDVLDAQKVDIFLDPKNQVESAVATGNPVVHSTTPTSKLNLAADTLTAHMRDGGKDLDTLVAEGHVRAQNISDSSAADFTAERMTATFQGAKNELQQIVGENNVVIKVSPSQNATASAQPAVAGNDSMLSLTKSNDVKIISTSRVQVALRPGGKEFERMECPGPSKLELIPPQATQDRRTVKGDRFDGTFTGSRNVLEKFNATGHVTVDLEPQAPQPASTHRKTQSDLLTAQFDPETGLLSRLDQSGNFHFYETPLKPPVSGNPILHQATAASAHYSAANKTTLLEGRPQVWDASSRTTARSITMDEQADKTEAEGNVLTVYQDKKASVSPFTSSNSPVFISSDHLVGHPHAKTAVYNGNARMWQDDDVLSADEIQLDQTAKTLVAVRHVMTTLLVQQQENKGKKDFVSISADSMKYEDELNRARYQKDVIMKGEMGILRAPLLDVFLVEKPQPHENRVREALAQGGVVIDQPQRHARSEVAHFYANENKVVLTGGHPTIVDADKGASTGRELTFFTSDDRILIDGDNQARATTQHKVVRQ